MRENRNFIVYIFILSLMVAVPLRAQMRWNAQYQTYINQYRDLAIEQMKRYHIPASITLAQGLFESRAGLSDLTIGSNNHFGIKCGSTWTGATTHHDDDALGECFRVYDNAYDSYEDHSRFLSNNRRYARLFNLSEKDYRGWAQGLKDCGYATNPAYSQKLIDIIELYKLYEYDHAKTYDKYMADRVSRDRPTSNEGYLHPIKIFNKNYYLIARRGDTFNSIADEVDISSRALARYNERDRHEALTPGDIIYLKKKRTKAPKMYRDHPHTVKAGDSMYGIAQFYGIRLKSLYKMNHLSPDYQIRAGDMLRVR
jgi:LysM repeat protein